MRKTLEMLGGGALNLVANAGVAIPYFFALMLYNQHKTEPVFALPFLMLYTFRCIGMLLTSQIKKSASTMLNVSNLFGVIGSIALMFSGQAFFGVLGGILLGLSSSWTWPYFLTMRSHGKLDNEFSMDKKQLASSGVTLLILLLVSWLATKTNDMALAFAFLAVMFLLSWVGGVFMKQEIDFYHNNDYKAKFVSPSRVILNLVYLTILVILMFSIRYSRLTTTSHYVDLIMCIFAAIVFGMLIYYQLGLHKRIFPLSLVAINRGIVMNFLLLYSSFDSTLRFGFNSMVIVFVIYLLGFELGPMILKKHVELRFPLLLVGLLLSLFNFAPVYFIGLLLCAIFVGADNVILNNSLYSHPNLDGERAFLIKYQLSSVGNISQQLIYMTAIYMLSYFNNLNVLSFFNSTVKGATYSMLTGLHTGITLEIFVISSITYYCIRKFYPKNQLS